MGVLSGIGRVGDNFMRYYVCMTLGTILVGYHILCDNDTFPG